MAGGFFGKLLAALLIAVCVVLGFGPDTWAKFMIGEWATPLIARIGFVLLAIVTAFAILWPWIDARRSAHSGQKPNPPDRVPAEDKLSPQPIATTTRIKYSDQQVIVIDYRPSFGKWSLNLDNVATLETYGPRDLNSIGLILAETAPVNIANPQPNQRYSAGGVEMTFPGVAIPGIRIKEAHLLVGSAMQQFVFRTDHPTHSITVGTRVFRVTLRSVNDNSTPELPRIEYVFAISEEWLAHSIGHHYDLIHRPIVRSVA